MILEMINRMTDDDAKYQIAREYLKEKISEDLRKGLLVHLKSDYSAEGLLCDALSHAGLKNFMTVPTKSHTEIDPVTFEISQ